MALAVAASVCSAQWIQTHGPVGLATCFAGDGTNLYVGTIEHGVSLSTNNGTNWTQTGLTSASIEALAVSGTNLFAGGGGVFLSTNNGTSWTPVNSGLTNTSVNALAISGTNLFAGTSNSGVFLSSNNGTSWTAIDSGLTNTFVHALAVSGTNLFAGTWGGGVFLSTNNGTSWTQAGLTNTFVTAFAISGTNLFAGGSGGVFLSTNNGTSWTAVDSGLNVYSLAVSGTNLFAGTWEGVFLSTNNGTSWTHSSLTYPSYALLVSNTNLFAATSCGVYFSADNGSSWTTPVFTGVTGDGHVTALAVSGSELFAGIVSGGRRGWGGSFHSTDNGETWVPQLDLTARTFAMLANDVYAGTWNGVLRSTNNGASWSPANTGLPYDSVHHGYPSVVTFGVSGTNLFAGTGGSGVFLSNNNGTSWTPASNGLTNPIVQSFAVSSTNLFAGTRGGVFLSTNNGVIWTRVSIGLTDTSVLSLAVLGTNLFAGTGYYSRGGGVFRSTNNGTSWSPANTGLPRDSAYGYYPGIMAFAVSGTNLFAGTFLGGVFLSTNNGTNWESVNSGMTDNLISTLAVSGTHLFAGTGADDMGGSWGTGVWKRPLSEMITSVSVASQLPKGFVLEQNYPNPFNPSTTIRYALLHTSFVTLTVFSTLGQQVARLVNEQQQAGYHDVVFRGDGLASGVYFYRIQARLSSSSAGGQAGDFVASKKFLLLR